MRVKSSLAAGFVSVLLAIVAPAAQAAPCVTGSQCGPLTEAACRTRAHDGRFMAQVIVASDPVRVRLPAK